MAARGLGRTVMTVPSRWALAFTKGALTWDSWTTPRKRQKTAGRKIEDKWEDTTDAIGDKIDEVKADADVKKAEAERDSVKTRNDLKEKIARQLTEDLVRPRP